MTDGKPRQNYYIVTYAKVKYEGKMQYVIHVMAGKPSNRVKPCLDRNAFKYVTKARCTRHGHIATLQGQKRTIRYVDSHKCIKCVNDVAVDYDEYGRPYKFTVFGKNYHTPREIMNDLKFKKGEIDARINSKEDKWADWINNFEDCK